MILRRCGVLGIALLCLASAALAQTPAGAAGSDAAHRNEAIKRYEGLLANPSPALQARRDEMMFRLGLLYLEQAQAAAPSGDQYGNRASYQRAVLLLEQVLQKPGSPYREDALYYRAIALEETGRHDEAMGQLKELIRSHPNSGHAAEVWFRIGNDAIQKNRIGEALSAYEEVLRRGEIRYRDQASYMFAWSAFALHQEARARAALVDLLNRLATAGQTEEGLGKEATELLAKVTRSEGNLAVFSGPWVGARPAWVEPALRRTAELYRETSAFADAGRAYEQLLRDFPDVPDADEIDQKLVECWMKAGDPARAEMARARLVARHQSGDRLQAESVAKVAPLLRDSALFLHEQARTQKRPDLYKKSIDAYGTLAASIAPGEARNEAVFLRAEAAKEAGDVALAAESYKEVAETRDPKRGEEAAFRRVALLEDLRTRGVANVDQMLAAYEDYFRLYPGGPREPELRVRQSGYFFDQKRYAESIAAGAQIVGRVTDPAARQKLELQLARAAFAAGDPAQCGTWVKRLLAEPNLPPDMKAQAVEIHATALYQHAEQLKDRPLEAAGQYELLSRLYPQHKTAPAALYNAAVLMRDQGAKDRAAQLFQRLLTEFPGSELTRDATVAATAIYTETGDHRSASTVLEQAAARRTGSPESADLLYQAATQAKEGGSAERAAELYEKFLRASSGSDLRAAVARLAIAKARFAAGKDQEAERYAQETISRAPMTATGDEPQRLQLVNAEARLLLGELAIRRYERVRLVEPLAKALPQKQAALDELVRQLTTAAGYGFADVSLASTFKIGYAQLAFANALMNAPRPRNLRPDEMSRYEELLREQVRPYREAAEKAFRLTLEKAQQAGIENEWTARARVALGEFGGVAGARPTT